MPVLAKAVANYFLDLAKASDDLSVSPMKLQKLVYFAHGWHLGITGEPLLVEEIEAWPYGPVVPCLYHEFKHYRDEAITDYATDIDWGGVGTGRIGFRVIAPKVPEDSPVRTLLDNVWKSYRPYTPLQLSNFTHEADSPWGLVNAEHAGAIPKGTPIPSPLIRDYFARRGPAAWVAPRLAPTEVRKLPLDRRRAILESAAAAAEADYQTNPDLTDFEAFGEEDE